MNLSLHYFRILQSVVMTKHIMLGDGFINCEHQAGAVCDIWGAGTADLSVGAVCMWGSCVHVGVSGVPMARRTQ